MFTGMIGYLAIIEDEQEAFELLRKNRRLQKPIVENLMVQVKEIGDGVLSFSTVTDAVWCASKIQKACADIDDLQLRIGANEY